MQKIIDQILEGNFDYENGSLDFSCSKIELSLLPGEVCEGSFRVYANRVFTAVGSIMSSDMRMECLTEEFQGGEEEIFYRFHGENLEEGEVVKGNFYIVSNQGEYYLPFVANVEYRVMDSSIGPIKNLFHFANLAKINWQEAVKLFYSSDFDRIFSGRDSQYADDYRALSAHSGSEANMEEFLIQVNKKQRVDFQVEESRLVLDYGSDLNAESVAERELTVARNGWGYTRIFVECGGDFLFKSLRKDGAGGFTVRAADTASSPVRRSGDQISQRKPDEDSEHTDSDGYPADRLGGDCGENNQERHGPSGCKSRQKAGHRGYPSLRSAGGERRVPSHGLPHDPHRGGDR